MGNLFSKSNFNCCFKQWKYLMLIFMWSESWTSYVKTRGTSESNWFLNLVLKLPWEYLTHSIILWGSTNLMWPIQKMFILSVKKCSMFSIFWMAPLVHNFEKFSLEKHVFHLARRWLFPLCLWYLTAEICRFTFPWNDNQVCCTFCSHIS